MTWAGGCGSASRLALLGLVVGTLAGCDGDGAPVRVRFDRTAASVGAHVLPTEAFRSDRGLVEAFTERQWAALPFLNRLALHAPTAWWGGATIRVPFTPAPDDPGRWIDVLTVPASVRLYRLEEDGATPVPLAEHAVSGETNTVTARAAVPLAPGRYGLVVRAGALRTRDGDVARTAASYRRVRESGDPATDAGFAKVAGHPGEPVQSRDDSLAYFEFRVQDAAGQTALLREYVRGKVPALRVAEGGDLVEETLDVTAVGASEGTGLAVAPLRVVAGEGADTSVEAFYAGHGLEDLAAGGLDGIGRVVYGLVNLPSFRADPSADVLRSETIVGRVVERPFGPDNPAVLSETAPFRAVPYLAFFPSEEEQGEGPPPVVVGIHGLSLSKESFLPLADALCSAGFALVAVDLVQHGERQGPLEVTLPPELPLRFVPEGDFADRLDPSLAAMVPPVEFPDPFLNPTLLGRTRDRVRQSVVDQLALIRLLAVADGASTPVDFDADGAPDDYGPVSVVGQSLGAIVATQVAAVEPEVERVALSVPGGGLPDIVRESASLSHDTNLLMYATADAPELGLMAGGAGPLLPGTDAREVYDVVAQQVLAPADALSFAPHVLSGALGGGSPRVLVQLARGDEVIPNDANARLVRALGAPLGNPDALPLLVDGDLNEVWFDVGRPVRDVAGEGLPPSGSWVAEYPAGHTFLLDFEDPGITTAAQERLVAFLLAP
ncbi:MAG: hypothetical protein ACQEXJ_05355 [Myxococcota bacterium]